MSKQSNLPTHNSDVTSAQLDEKSILKVAQLSRLKISHSEAVQLSEQLSKVISHFDEISKINTDQVEPMITPVHIEAKYREDQVEHDYSTEEMLKNAPDKLGFLFKVPPVV